mgnify:CR=1 FL=1
MKIDETVFREFIGEGGELFLEAVGTLKLATFISNIVVDTGDFVKQAAYTQGYAELATLYSLKLKEDKTKFQSAKTAANAWEFFEDYTMLWALRYQGEQQYLKMNTIKMFLFEKVKTFNYDMKEEVVNDTLSQLNTRKFEFSDKYSVPKSIMYNKKSVINCPVDVEISTKDGKIIEVLRDGIESDTTNEYGRFAVVYQPYSGEYAKVICQSTDEELIIKATAISDGLVDWQMSTNQEGECVVYSFDKEYVAKGDVVETTSKIDNESTYAIRKNGENTVCKFVEQKTNDYIAVKSLMIKSNSINMNVGEYQVARISVLPKNATNKDVKWRSSDENIVTVKNGDVADRFDELRDKLSKMQQHMWGVATDSRASNRMEHIEFTVQYADGEQHIPRRLERQKRIGQVEYLGEHACRFSADVYDASELIPWIRTFICRITDISISNKSLETQFKEDLQAMYEMYGLKGEE